jgi:pimeloyl-ACP methyl ester carboxylesterase
MLATRLEIVQKDKRLRVARLGSGPPLVLLHGYPDNLQIWSELAPRLADYSEVIAFDWPGMGYSDAWTGGATPIHQAQRLLALLDSWQLERIQLVGLDMGGQPALVFAARYPERIAQLVVMNSLAYWDLATSWEIRLLRQFQWNSLILRHLPWLVFRRAERTFLPPGVRLPSHLRADLWESFRQLAVRMFIIRMCAGYQGLLPRLPEMYRQIACSTLILWAEQDKHFPPIHAERLHTDIAGSRLEIVAGAEHWMAWYRAEEIAQRLRIFLA